MGTKWRGKVYLRWSQWGCLCHALFPHLHGANTYGDAILYTACSSLAAHVWTAYHGCAIFPSGFKSVRPHDGSGSAPCGCWLRNDVLLSFVSTFLSVSLDFSIFVRCFKCDCSSHG